MSQLILGIVIIASAASIAAVLGFWGTQMAREGWASWKESKRQPVPNVTKTPEQISEELRSYSTAQSEIGADIEYLNVVLVFKDAMGAAEAEKEIMHVGLRKTTTSRQRTIETIVHVLNGEASGNITWGFQFVSRTRMADDEDRFGGSSVVTGTLSSSLTELPIPLFIGRTGLLSYTSIRELKEAELVVHMTPALAKEIVRIEVVANSTRHFVRRLRLYSIAVDPTQWEETKINPGGALAASITMWKPKFSYQEMLIYPETAVWNNGDVMPEMLRIQYR